MKKLLSYLSLFFVTQLIVTVLSNRKTGGVFGMFWNNILGQGTGGVFIIFLGVVSSVYLIYLSVTYLIKENIFQKYKHSILVIPLVLVASVFIYLKSSKKQEHKSNSSDNSNCVGNSSCISNIRSNFTSTNKTILNESYLDKGEFKITALDVQRGVTFNATISTDCNCNITNIDVSDID